jgi:hypothetical protein
MKLFFDDDKSTLNTSQLSQTPYSFTRKHSSSTRNSGRSRSIKVNKNKLPDDFFNVPIAITKSKRLNTIK